MKKGGSLFLVELEACACWLLGTFSNEKNLFFAEEVWWNKPNLWKQDLVRNWPEMPNAKPIVPFNLPTRPSWVKDFLHFVWPRKIAFVDSLSNARPFSLIPPPKIDLLRALFEELLTFKRKTVTTHMKTNPAGNFYTFAGKNCYLGLKGHCKTACLPTEVHLIPTRKTENDPSLCPEKGATVYWKAAAYDSKEPDYWFVPSEELDSFLLLLCGQITQEEFLESFGDTNLAMFLTDADWEKKLRRHFEIKP